MNHSGQALSEKPGKATAALTGARFTTTHWTPVLFLE
jgi:hypothetical protein